jgi:Flp pilus assembly protein TadG
MNSPSHWLRRSAAALRLDRRGNVAVMFGLAAVPLAGFVGAAIDFSRANSVQAELQAALDSTALMLSKEAATDTSAQLQANTGKYFRALFTSKAAKDIQVSAAYTAGTSSVKVDGSARVPMTFMGLMGYDETTVSGSSTATWGSTRLRVALVLDNTGSMAEAGKMGALKTATKNLLTQLKSSANTNGDVYVSIIPFSKDVNVGRNNYNADWIDWDDWEDSNGSWQSTSNCSGSSRRGRSRCNNSNKWVPAAHSTWNGCITDRDQDYDQLVTAPKPSDADLPIGRASTLFPAEQFGDCPLPMRGLSYDWTAMNNLVDAMYPAGNTNQPIGLVWGWQSLVGGGPLSAPPKDPTYKYHEIIILLSDGLNTENRWNHTQTPIDNRMLQKGNGSGTCANIKAAGITIYTIHVNTGGDPTSSLLRDCASGPDKFFVLTRSDQIVGAFDTIATKLTQLRIAK